MSIKAGLVGLPNVGKSTLFNALTRSSVPAQNYPFCTIEPHLAITNVPDPRLTKLLTLYGSKKIIPATVSFVDIAGLVKGAASGEGLGNKFLSHIREVDLILHVLRCFEDTDITHTQTDIDPIADYEIICAELMLKDLESINKRQEKIEQLLKSHSIKPPEKAQLIAEQTLLKQVIKDIDAGDASAIRKRIQESKIITIPLLSAKKFLIIANIAEEELDNQGYEKNPHYQALIEKFGDRVIAISAKIEQELAQMNDEESQELMNMIGIKSSGLDRIIELTYHHLGLITFFTCGPQEIHAWPIKKGISVREAAGEIHSDLQRGFICAEIFSCNDILEYKTTAKLKELGKVRTEGQDYIVQDGDIILVRFNV